MATLKSTDSTIELLESLVAERFRTRGLRYPANLDLSTEAFEPTQATSGLPWYRDPAGRAAMHEVREHIVALRLLRCRNPRTSGVHFTPVASSTAATSRDGNVVHAAFGDRRS